MTSNKVTKSEISEFLMAGQGNFYRFAFSYVKSREAALDVVQDASISALASYEKLREPQYLKTWFYRILVNCSINYIRKNKKYVLTEDSMIFENQDNQSADNAENLDLYKAVCQLPLKLKTIVVLRFFEDMKISEIARITMSPESTVKTRLKSALDKLSKTI